MSQGFGNEMKALIVSSLNAIYLLCLWVNQFLAMDEDIYSWELSLCVSCLKVTPKKLELKFNQNQSISKLLDFLWWFQTYFSNFRTKSNNKWLNCNPDDIHSFSNIKTAETISILHWYWSQITHLYTINYYFHYFMSCFT